MAHASYTSKRLNCELAAGLVRGGFTHAEGPGYFMAHLWNTTRTLNQSSICDQRTSSRAELQRPAEPQEGKFTETCLQLRQPIN